MPLSSFHFLTKGRVKEDYLLCNLNLFKNWICQIILFYLCITFHLSSIEGPINNKYNKEKR